MRWVDLFKRFISNGDAIYQTPEGLFSIPTDNSEDVIFNTIKAGKVFEPEIVQSLQKFVRPNSIGIDVGANVGQMSILLSEKIGPSGRIISIEADPFIFSYLAQNVKLNKRENITLLNLAAYETSGQFLSYPKPDFKRFKSYGSYGISLESKDLRRVLTLAIDDLHIQSDVCFIKVDTQGSDLHVLRGAEKTIRKYKPAVLFEFEEQFQNEFKTSWNDYESFIKSIDYKIESTINQINFLCLPN